MNRTTAVLSRTAVFAALGVLIFLSGCDRDSEHGDGRAVATPVVVSPPPATQEQVDQAATSPGSRQSTGHVPHLVDATSGQYKHTNRLINETSPYLLQHAHNPVNWYAWGPAAFEAARQQDKPIFMSVGYSTCYWCHVMERESFEDEEIAAYMNQHFISIKVDREERPDVDDIYMAGLNSMGLRGGWPMTAFLEPNALKPFFGGTYFPKQDRGGRQGFGTLLRQIAGQWANQRSQLIQRADQVAARVRRTLASSSLPQAVGRQEVANAVASFMSGYDQVNGGFRRGAPKFPLPTNLQLLMGAGWDNPAVRQAVLHTLDRMAMGGIYDQIGGGFHRYSTDRRWLVPHFEKMLYDNGQLASVYADAYERTRDPYYAQVLRETLDYILREMMGPQGRLYSAQDAEAAEREGASYVWTNDQVISALREAALDGEADFALQVYGLSSGTNFQDPHHLRDGRKNVLYLSSKPAAQAQALGISNPEFKVRLEKVDEALMAARNGREQPITDDKTLVGWNGLMIAGLAEGGRVLNEQRYVDAARNAVGFILAKMRTEDGGLFRTYRSGTAKIDAFVEDYAFFIRGLLALHWATGDDQFVQHAGELAQAARQRFWDDQYGGFFDTLDGQADLFVRTKSTRDGVIPSGNSVMVHNLLDLHRFTGDPRYLSDAAATLGFLSSKIKTRPTSMSMAVLALKRFVDTYPEYLPGRPAGRQ